jgi:hypothetical protein
MIGVGALADAIMQVLRGDQQDRDAGRVVNIPQKLKRLVL